jgi:hypothetical protein
VFHVLKWTPKELARAIDTLTQEKVIRESEIEGVKGRLLVPSRLL